MSCSMLRVEPVIFLSFAALFYYQLVRDTGFYRVICRKNSVNATNITNCDQSSFLSGQLENVVQKQATFWIMASVLSVIVPAMGSNLLLSALSDIKGRKIPMVLGLAGSIVAILPVIALFTYPDSVPMYAVLPGKVFCGLCGSVTAVLLAAYAFLVDTVKDEHELTVRMTVLMVCLSVGQTLGTFMGGKLLNLLSVAHCTIGAVLLYTLALIYCLIAVPNTTMTASDGCARNTNRNLSRNTENSLLGKGKCNTSETLLQHTKTLTIQIYETFFKRRPGWRRCFLQLLLAVSFIATLVDLNAASILTLYVYHKPLYWSPEQYGTWKAIDSVVGSFGALVTLYVFKKCCGLNECALILIGLCSCIAQRVTIGVLSVESIPWTSLPYFGTSAVMYGSTVVGVASRVVAPVVSAMATRLVDGAEEAGKLFGGVAVISILALIFGALSFNTIYAETVAWWPGFVFILMATLTVGGAVLICWMWWKSVQLNKVESLR